MLTRLLLRYDVLVAPRKPGEPGAVLEFKIARDATPRAVAAALTEALAQIKSKGYAAQLKARGAAPILCYGVACFGKQLWVRREGEREPKKASKRRKKGSRISAYPGGERRSAV